MINYRSNLTSPTTLQVALVVATLGVNPGAFADEFVGPAPLRTPHESVLPKPYWNTSASSTYDRFNSLISEKREAAPSFESELVAFYTDLSEKQSTLPQEFSSVLMDNLWDLYTE